MDATPTQVGPEVWLQQALCSFQKAPLLSPCSMGAFVWSGIKLCKTLLPKDLHDDEICRVPECFGVHSGCLHMRELRTDAAV